LYSTPSALPLILVRHFSREKAAEKEEPNTEEANSDFEEIEPLVKHNIQTDTQPFPVIYKHSHIATEQ
jgi:hypothetical protein